MRGYAFVARRPSQFCGTPDCNEGAALHSHGLDAHCRSVLRDPTTGWDIGIVEAVTISMLLGSSVDFSLHIAEAWVSSSSSGAGKATPSLKRGAILSAALRKIAISLLMASVTTTVSVALLTLCEVKMFSKVGLLVSASTVASVGFALLPLSALLAGYGPTARRARTLRRACAWAGGAAACAGACACVLFVSGVTVLTPSGTPLFGGGSTGD